MATAQVDRRRLVLMRCHPHPPRSRAATAPLQGRGELVLRSSALLSSRFTLLAAAMASPRTRRSFPTNGNTAGGRTGSTLQYCLDVRDPDLPVARRDRQGDCAGAAARAQTARNRPKYGRRGYRQSLSRVSRNLRRLSRLQADPGRLSAMARDHAALLPDVLRPGDGRSRLDVARRHAAVAGDRCHHRHQRRHPADPISAGAAGGRAAGAGFPWVRTNLRLPRSARGTVGVALVWGPSFWALQTARSLARQVCASSRPSRCRIARSTSARRCLPSETFLRSNIDQAIASLTADGSIQAILDSEKFPATPVEMTAGVARLQEGGDGLPGRWSRSTA